MSVAPAVAEVLHPHAERDACDIALWRLFRSRPAPEEVR